MFVVSCVLFACTYGYCFTCAGGARCDVLVQEVSRSECLFDSERVVRHQRPFGGSVSQDTLVALRFLSRGSQARLVVLIASVILATSNPPFRIFGGALPSIEEGLSQFTVDNGKVRRAIRNWFSYIVKLTYTRAGHGLILAWT